MVTNYPASIDGAAQLPLVSDNLTSLKASVINNLRNAIVAVETELGVKPSGVYGTVRARLDAIESSFIHIGGDIGGTAASPLVIGIRGRPVTSIQPNVGEALLWTGSAWSPHGVFISGGGSGVIFSGDISGNDLIQAVVGLQGRPLLSAAPATGQSIVWNGSAWAPSNNAILDSIIDVGNADYTVTNIQDSVFLNMHSLTGPHTITLPASPATGQKVVVKDTDGSLATHNIVVSATGGKIIDGATSYTLSNIQGPYSSLSVQYNGVSWSIV